MKNIFLIILLSTLSFFSYGQWGKKSTPFEFNHGLGMSFMVFNAPVGTGYLPTFGYFPRMNFVRFSNDLSLSFDLPVNGYLKAALNSMEGSYATYFLEVDGSVNLNFGHMATKSSKSRIGGFLGIGVGYNTLRYYETNYYTQEQELSDATKGIYFTGGVRWLGIFGKSFRTPSVAGLYMLVGFNDIICFGLRFSKEFGYKVEKKNKKW